MTKKETCLLWLKIVVWWGVVAWTVLGSSTKVKKRIPWLFPAVLVPPVGLEIGGIKHLLDSIKR